MDQTQSMLQTWMDAQKTLWQSWANLAMPSQSSPFSSGLIDQWQKLAQQNLDALTRDSSPIAKSTADQFLAAQGMVLRFLEFSTRAWQATAPQFASGGDWQSAMKQSVEQMRREWVQAPGEVAGAARDTEKLWQLYIEQWKSFGQPWQAVFSQMPGNLGQAAMGKSSAMIELSNQYREAYNETFGRLAASPNLGLTRELNQKVSRGFDAFVALQLANLEYQGVLAGIWDQAFQNFANELVALGEQDKKIDNVRDLILLWTRGAEQIFSQAFRDEKYVLAQGKLLGASMTYRQSERAIIEVFLKMYDLPTRTELDETHRRIYELRKEVKALKKAMAKLDDSTENRASRRKTK
jgi:class III poly(R)-hydroxyalkanoic acid synthase PhaE subunit